MADVPEFPDTVFYTERLTAGGSVVKKAYYSQAHLKQAIAYHKGDSWRLIVAYNTNPETAVYAADFE